MPTETTISKQVLEQYSKRNLLFQLKKVDKRAVEWGFYAYSTASKYEPKKKHATLEQMKFVWKSLG